MFDTVFNLNVKARYLLTAAFAPAMAERGHGAIVNVGPRGVRVNSVDPGDILTPINAHIRDMYEGYLASVPAARGGRPDEVAEAIRFFVSPRASYIQGAVLAVDGGKNAVVAM